MQLHWTPVTHRGETYLYAQGIRGRYDGDDCGNEWECGYAILAQESVDRFGEPQRPWALYEDDGTGGGDFIGDFETIWEAADAATTHDANPFEYHGPTACYWCGPGVLASHVDSAGHDVCHPCFMRDDGASDEDSDEEPAHCEYPECG